MSSTDSCKDNDDVCDVNDMLQKMSTVDNEVNGVSICANCGKEGANNICNKCKVTTYCNAVCKKVHKKKHKKDCEEHIRLAAEKHNEELRLAAEKHDEKLFKEPPSQHGDCPICFLRLPTQKKGWRYHSCCGKVICSGCVLAPLYDHQGNEVDNKKCPFCRTPTPSTIEEMIKRDTKQFEKGDPLAIYKRGKNHEIGETGFPQDHAKALELYHRASNLGNTDAYCNIGHAYDKGKGVKIDKEKAKYYYERAAMMGNETARYNLGFNEKKAGNMDRAIKHYMIAVASGDPDSLKRIQIMYSDGHATKEDYTAALQSYQSYLEEIKSIQRDKAAVFSEEYRYY